MASGAEGDSPRDDDLGNELTSRIGKVARRVLEERGVTRYDQLTGWTTTDLLDLHGIGPKAVRILSEELESRGTTFRAG
ncbi:hypothetical protein SANBI_001387 [Sanguibacter sp. 4.1]|uniref:DNA-binding protein n=1 Tax=Sanguibacter biliveldensis TaxID=3030830 RepID=A0AAF0Z9Q3_9MICO|nr:hypothetical protein [Sanguibacter sp. 4.1]WPF83692.1 hypothetical protein SANBI_001387 [Sanguibacter sp. 4.1]